MVRTYKLHVVSRRCGNYMYLYLTDASEMGWVCIPRGRGCGTINVADPAHFEKRHSNASTGRIESKLHVRIY